MPFSFSFNLAVPGITNPFAAAAESEQARAAIRNADIQHPQAPRRRPPSPSLLPPRSRKRGWVPSSAEPSRPTSIHTSTSGYLDTPAKYRDMASESSEQDEVEEMVADLPPPKRRRTLAGSIVSTALSAALIGTAVGLTVYRLWRDRGKHPEALPPPPYEQGGWVPPESDQAPVPETPKVVVTAPTTPRSKKSRHVAGRRTIPRHRRAHSRVQASTSHSTAPSSYISRSPMPAEFSSASSSRLSPPQADDEPDVDEHMSWIGDRLAHLIAEGQKALGKEVVIMSEDKEDEVDDGSGAWVEDDEPAQGSSRLPGLPLYSPSLRTSASPSKTRFDRGVSVESDTRSIRSAFAEDDSAWATQEMRESMERARILYRQKRGY